MTGLSDSLDNASDTQTLAHTVSFFKLCKITLIEKNRPFRGFDFYTDRTDATTWGWKNL